MKQLVLLILLLTSGIHFKCLAQNSQKTNLFQFKAGSDVLYEHYATNASELKRVRSILDEHTNNLLSNNGHIQLIAYLPENQKQNMESLNLLAFQASVVRSWIRKYNKKLEKLSCSFYFSTTPSFHSGISVDYIPTPLDADTPQNIYYSIKKGNIESIRREINKYQDLPFISVVKKDFPITSKLDNLNISSTRPFILYFRVNKSNIDATYMSNSTVLSQINNIINNQNIKYIDSLIISAYASPEAPSIYNKKLSLLRANALRNYFLEQCAIRNPEMIQTYGHGENWNDLYQMAEEDIKLPMRQEVLNIINSTLPEDEREKRLKKLNKGRVYHYIYTNYYPRLRLGASFNIMLNKTAPEHLRSLLFQSTIQPLTFIKDTLSISSITLPTLPIDSFSIDVPHFKYIRPIAIKTNLLFDAATLLNIELEFPVLKNYSFLAEWTFPFWGGQGNAGGVAPVPSYSEAYTLQMLSGGLEARYWFPRSKRLNKKAQQWGDYNPLNGWFVGLYGGAGIYDFQWDGKGLQGEFYIASGLSAGYAHPIKKYFHMEYSVGIGYIATRYYNYTARDGHKVVDIRPDGKYDRRQQSFFGPTKLKVALVWMPRFKINKKKGGALK